jgi:hypothetical protein
MYGARALTIVRTTAQVADDLIDDIVAQEQQQQRLQQRNLSSASEMTVSTSSRTNTTSLRH